MFKKYLTEEYKTWLTDIIVMVICSGINFAWAGLNIYIQHWKIATFSAIVGLLIILMDLPSMYRDWNNYRNEQIVQKVMEKQLIADDQSFDPVYRKKHRRHLN